MEVLNFLLYNYIPPWLLKITCTRLRGGLSSRLLCLMTNKTNAYSSVYFKFHEGNTNL